MHDVSRNLSIGSFITRSEVTDSVYDLGSVDVEVRDHSTFYQSYTTQ